MRENIPLEMAHVFPSFILLGFGVVPSIIVFIFELLYRCCQKKVANKTPDLNLRHNSEGHDPNDVVTSSKEPDEVEKQVTFSFNYKVLIYRR